MAELEFQHTFFWIPALFVSFSSIPVVLKLWSPSSVETYEKFTFSLSPLNHSSRGWDPVIYGLTQSWAILMHTYVWEALLPTLVLLIGESPDAPELLAWWERELPGYSNVQPMLHQGPSINMTQCFQIKVTVFQWVSFSPGHNNRCLFSRWPIQFRTRRK